MSNRREKENERDRLSSSGFSRHTTFGRSSDVTARKSSVNKFKKTEESSEASKRSFKAGVFKDEPRKSGARAVSTGVCRARASAEATATASASASLAVKHTVASFTRKKATVGQETSQVTRTIKRRPVNRTAENTASPQQIWRVKTEPESSDRKESSARIHQPRPAGGTSKLPSKTTNSSPLTSNQKKSASKKKVSRKEPLHKDQSSQRKHVQKATHNKASTSGVKLESPSNPECHIEWAGFDEPDNRIGVCCSICEEDLGIEPDNDDDDIEYSTIPVVAILPCGHVFHNLCLNPYDFEGQPEEPPCVLCQSF